MIPKDVVSTAYSRAGRQWWEDHVSVVKRHLAEARATPPEITLTAHDVANLVRIRDAGPCRTLSDVLRDVLDAAARAVRK